MPRMAGTITGASCGDAESGATVAEKSVTLAVSVRLRSVLAARGFQVITTREGNVTLDNTARAQMANHSMAAACLSLHASETGSGVHLVVSSLQPAGPARFVAWKTAQAAFVSRSVELAGTINGAFEHGSDKGPIASTLAKATLPVVDSMACPAVAIEIGPVRGADRQVVTRVTDQDYQSQIVDALANAMLEWRTVWEADPHGGRQP